MKLIENWREWHKLYSMQLNFVATISDILMALIIVLNETFPFDPLWYVGIRLTLTLASMGARLVVQQE